MNYDKKNGISLLILVISMIVMIILASAIILLIINNNPIHEAKKTSFLSDLKNFITELDVYNNLEFSNNRGRYNLESLQADGSSVTYDGVKDETKTMYDIIPTLGKTTKYHGRFIIVNGELVYAGFEADEKNWSLELGVNQGEPRVTFKYPIDTSVSSGTDIIYIINFTSTVAIKTIYLTGKVEVLDNLGVKLSTQPNILIGEASGTSTDNTRQVVVTITTDNLTKGIYKLKVKAGSATDFNNATNSIDVISPIGFIIESVVIDNTPPDVATLSINPTSWTNGSVTVTITYPLDVVTKEYSINGVVWNTYSTGVIISSNNTTVYARGRDASGNQSLQASIKVENIDKIFPTVSYGTNGATDVITGSTTVTVSDTGGSNINTGTLQYVWDTQNTVTPSSGWTTFTNGETITKENVTGTYYLWIKGLDNAGNLILSKTNAFIIDNRIPEAPTLVASPTAWTNENVTVTITYPEDTFIKEYSTDTSTWNIYTSPIVVTTSNTIIYARGKNIIGNQSSQSSVTIANIDKIAPIISYDTNGASNVKTAITTVTAIDTGGSDINISTLQYVWDTQNTVTPSSGWLTFTNGGSVSKGSVTGTYYLWIKGSDNAGNSIVSKTNAFMIDNTVPTAPNLAASPTAWTNGNVTVTITYPVDASVKEYSTDTLTWTTYVTGVVVTNNTIVYAKAIDAAGNQSSQSSLTVANIDKIPPTVTYGTNGGTVQTVSTTITVNDIGGSNVKTNTLQFKWDTQNVTTPSSGWSSFTNGTTRSNGSLPGTYYLWVKAGDNALNNIVSVTNAFIIPYNTINGLPYAYNNPIIPPGFTPLTTTGANWNNVSTDWNNGLVIQDASGNQFVWVPVNGTSITYAKAYNPNEIPVMWAASLNDWSIPYPYGQFEYAQITKYGGFYIGRYESAFGYNGGNLRVRVIKSTNKTYTDWSSSRSSSYNGYLWNWITFTDAITYSQGMAASYGYTSLVTSIVSGTMWDTTLKWIESSGKDAYDSRSWGNHNNSVHPASVYMYSNLVISGFSEYWKAKNIYDLAGNVFEFTGEFFDSSIIGRDYIIRGGAYNASGISGTMGNPVSIRKNFATEKYDNVSFRVALYIL